MKCPPSSTILIKTKATSISSDIVLTNGCRNILFDANPTTHEFTLSSHGYFHKWVTNKSPH